MISQIEFRIVDTAIVAGPATVAALATAIVPATVIGTMETITTADIRTIVSIMIAIKAIAAATKIIVTSDHGIKAIGMCRVSILSIGCAGIIIIIEVISMCVCAWVRCSVSVDPTPRTSALKHLN